LTGRQSEPKGPKPNLTTTALKEKESMIRESLWKFCANWKRTALAALAVLALLSISFASSDHNEVTGVWVAGDFHQHTTYTDGNNSFRTVMYKAYQYGLDWWANSEHGGAFATDARGPLAVNPPYDSNSGRLWSTYPAGTIWGDNSSSGKMWRWQSIRDFSFFDILQARATLYKPIIQGVEWNVPGHEHCSVGIIANQFNYETLNADPVAQFEYLFDAGDSDINGGLAQGWTGKNTTNNHAKAVAAAAWLQQHYANSSWMVPAHVERKGAGNPSYVGSGSYGYNISDFRDLNNAAPDVCFGFESMPGHQKEINRGGYAGNAAGGGTFGGAGYYSATIGGLWDALLGEGRHWWLFASSDFHNTANDFWPGEYQKTYTFVQDPNDPQAIVDGLRSGNSFVVEGDLIDGLDFQIGPSGIQGWRQGTDDSATMGQSLEVRRSAGNKQNIRIVLRFHSPKANNNGDGPQIDHIDLISGSIGGMALPGTAAYSAATNPSTQVVETFFRKDFKKGQDGWYSLTCEMKLAGDAYFRLRGTNLPWNTSGQTDARGNPLLDPLGNNSAAEAYKDLWFYSNPMFIYVK
jgi:hypothetical protein